MSDLPKAISVADHVVEPPHVWQDRLPSRMCEVEKMTAGLTKAQRYKVLRGNAIRMLDLERV